MVTPLPAGVVDSTGMLEAIAGLPEQLEAAALQATTVDGLPDPARVEHVLVLGAGVGGVAGDVLRVVAGEVCPVPIVVHRGYSLPPFVSEATLCVALSFSGDTEETLEAAQEAAVAGARMVVVSGRGHLAELARAWDAPGVAIDPSIPVARAGIGALAVAPLIVLERMGLCAGAAANVALAVDQLCRRRDALSAPGGAAATLARRIGRTIPVIYGGGGLGGIAAQRWKAQVNANAKAPAFANVVPDLGHDEIAGWGQHGDVTRQVFSLVSLRHEWEHPQIQRQFEVVDELLDEVVADRHEVRAEGDGVLAQLLDLVLYGDFVSFHLAVQNEVDPGPADALLRMEGSGGG